MQAAAERRADTAGRCTLVLFGASGDLTQRMVIPAIFRLARRGLLSPELSVIGYARSRMTDNEFRARMRIAALQESGTGDDLVWKAFAERLWYISAGYDDPDGDAQLRRRFENDGISGAGSRRLFYLATPPSLFAPIVDCLSSTKLAGHAYQAAGGWSRLIVEKPFGHDLAWARRLNNEVVRRFDSTSTMCGGPV